MENCQTCNKPAGSNPRECDSCLEFLNASRMGLLGHTVQGAQAHGVLWANKFQEVHKLSLTDLFIFQKQLETITAEILVIYHTEQVKKRIPDPKKIEQAVLSRPESWESQDSKLKSEKIIRDAINSNRTKKERVVLSQRDKAIAGMVKIGMSREEAEAIVDKKGRE